MKQRDALTLLWVCLSLLAVHQTSLCLHFYSV